VARPLLVQAAEAARAAGPVTTDTGDNQFDTLNK
jgi:hypothetical protein